MREGVPNAVMYWTTDWYIHPLIANKSISYIVYVLDYIAVGIHAVTTRNKRMYKPTC